MGIGSWARHVAGRHRAAVLASAMVAALLGGIGLGLGLVPDDPVPVVAADTAAGVDDGVPLSSGAFAAPPERSGSRPIGPGVDAEAVALGAVRAIPAIDQDDITTARCGSRFLSTDDEVVGCTVLGTGPDPAGVVAVRLIDDATADTQTYVMVPGTGCPDMPSWAAKVASDRSDDPCGADPEPERAQTDPSAAEGIRNPASDDSSSPTLGSVWGGGQRGFGEVRPTRVSAGGDPTGIVEDITWSSWGAPIARGSGTAYWYGPDQVVADAVATEAVVVADTLGTCEGRPAYRQVRWYFPSKGESEPLNGFSEICGSG